MSNQQNNSEIDKRNKDHQNPLENHQNIHQKGSFQSVKRKSVNDYEDLIIEQTEQFRDRQKIQRPPKKIKNHPYLHDKGSFQSVPCKSINDYEDLIIKPTEQF